MNELKRTERGWAGHFICGDMCQFRRNTLLEYGDLRIVVSTVGQYCPPKAKEALTIGHDRYFETMVFMATKSGEYWEVDVSKQLRFDSKWQIDGTEYRSLRNYIDMVADAMHEDVVKEIGEKMVLGEQLVSTWDSANDF